MKLDPSKPIILVAAHVFSDAPNGLNDLLFDDFHEWLIETCLELKKNEKINFIVKEHPSSSLYGESDKVFEVLKNLIFKIEFFQIISIPALFLIQ